MRGKRWCSTSIPRKWSEGRIGRMMVFSGPSMLRLLATPVSALVFALVAVASAQAEVRIDITRGYLKPLPIAITEFHGVQPVEAETGRDISNVVSADLERSGLFQPIDPRAFIQRSDEHTSELQSL